MRPKSFIIIWAIASVWRWYHDFTNFQATIGTKAFDEFDEVYTITRQDFDYSYLTTIVYGLIIATVVQVIYTMGKNSK